MTSGADASASTVPDKRPVDASPLSSSDSKRAKIHSEILESAPDTAGPSQSESVLDAESTPAAEARPEGRKNRFATRRESAGFAKSRKNREKDTKNVGRRSGRGTRRNDETVKEGSEEEKADKAPRLPKRQCALLIGFCGTGCSGMQIQPNARTIEGVLFEAMVKAGAVSQDNADDPVKVNLGRAARTDAGVHAAGNVVSIKMITDVPGVPDIVGHINSFLPPEIRLWGYVRVQNSFNARVSCDSRKYTYFFPSYLLIPPKPGSGLYQTLTSLPPSSSGPDETPVELPTSHPFWSEPAHADSTKEDDLIRKRQWRVGSEMVEKLRDIAKKFEASHNFHNFTVGRDFSDRSTQRHMKKIEVADPAVYGETEWISVMFHGQSFMLHQRKMMSALVLSCRAGTPPQIIDELYGPRQVLVPKMPSLGLLLEHPIFESYNAKIARVNDKLPPTDPQYRLPIDFDIHKDAIEKFKQEHIYDRMRDIEDRGGVFDAWVRSIDAYSGNDLAYLDTKGIIPPSAVIKKGERRANPLRERRKFDLTSFSSSGKIDLEIDEEDGEAEQESTLDKAELAEMEG